MATRFDDWEGEFLVHYGVLGMRWGIRKNPESAFAKATEKSQKLDRRVTKALSRSVAANSKLVKAKQKFEADLKAANKYGKKAGKVKDADIAAKKQAKSDKYQSKANKLQETVRKYELRAQKADLKKDKATLKGKEWCESMLKAFNESSMEALERKYGRGG